MKKHFATKLTDNIHKTPEGFLICYNVPIARSGEMIYGKDESPITVGPDGRAIVSREPKEVFRAETIASFEGKPFTIKHPEDFVNPQNWKMLAKGHIQNVRKGSGEFENDLIADILVTDHEAILMVEGGIREVSCGYECEYIELGIGRGMQTNIIGNHLALVPQGRAGDKYAINDQKGAKMKKLGDKIKSIWSKAADEAAKVVDEAGGEAGGEGDTKETADEKAPAWAVKLEKTMARVADALSNPSMSQPAVADEKKDDDKKDDKAKDADESEEKKDDKKDDAKDEGGAEEDRLSKLEAKVDKLLAMMGEEAQDEEMIVEDEGEEEEAEDDDFEESPAAATTDEASRIEILAPGFKAKGKDAKRQTLMKAYESKDTKAIIERLNGGKAVDLKKASVKTIDHLFVGASEVVKVYRTKSFAGLKQVRDSQEMIAGGGEMTPEKINEINEKHYAQKGVH
ncbi:MAG: DUF2213 domain-containing protein [Nitrospirota bacterium]|nr:DUF2213 domain-containing protein [Nitrospirota bacterium]